ncbi:MAG: hypothetical protein JXR46_04060 [Calditrichaceae bacterium]|nr:hypothetical protein [Calditrichaceae bacterium]MBN2708201.1 hypothetical protein [Calditrichaceae bacterium]RQV97393.1 MAG: hypothetical protein EH224_01590 [Calditrichota bacterium]
MKKKLLNQFQQIIRTTIFLTATASLYLFLSGQTPYSLLRIANHNHHSSFGILHWKFLFKARLAAE